MSKKEDKPFVLTGMLKECGISQVVITKATGVRKVRLSYVLRGHGWPKMASISETEFRKIVEGIVVNSAKALGWLAQRGLTLKNIWDVAPKQQAKPPVLVGLNREEKPMAIRKVFLSDDVLAHFGLQKDPFFKSTDNPRDDIYVGEHGRQVADVARILGNGGGMVGLMGHRGAGKSTLYKLIHQRLREKFGKKIIFVHPLLLDKGKLTDTALCRAIIREISGPAARMKQNPEDMAIQVRGLLNKRFDDDTRSVIVIEEAHTLNPDIFVTLKALVELGGVGFEDYLSVLLIGQPAMIATAYANTAGDAVARTHLVEIGPVRDVAAYLGFKLGRVGAAVEMFNGDALEAMTAMLWNRGQQSESRPLAIDSLAAMCMESAAKLGEPTIGLGVLADAMDWSDDRVKKEIAYWREKTGGMKDEGRRMKDEGRKLKAA